MRRKRKARGKYRNRVRASIIVSGKHVSPQMCAVRFYWSGRRQARSRPDSSEQEVVEYRLAIRCRRQQATPMQVMAELTLGTVISSWMRWLYIRQNRPSRD
ncbi:MAG: hypothetical protein JO011_08865 [Ktedonobacteraceae bacterium]|nr:hypothetical protein [Ktedonobacteraceae bacterium]MBV9711010.1 hypothetical protein [Ktedonobacteraceae bacterium]